MGNIRGKVYNPGRNQQLKDMSGLRWGKITPTDLDALVDYQDKYWLYIEFKYGDTELPYGQRLAFERLCTTCNKIKPTLGIIAKHEQPQDVPIDCANATVTEVWTDGKFAKLTEKHTVKSMADAFLSGQKDAIKTYWAGVYCGKSGNACTLCRGVPCSGSTPIDAGI